jgi:hypothetical protein
MPGSLCVPIGGRQQGGFLFYQAYFLVFWDSNPKILCIFGNVFQ